jgi:hypothetical protein
MLDIIMLLILNQCFFYLLTNLDLNEKVSDSVPTDVTEIKIKNNLTQNMWT